MCIQTILKVHANHTKACRARGRDRQSSCSAARSLHKHQDRVAHDLRCSSGHGLRNEHRTGHRIYTTCEKARQGSRRPTVHGWGAANRVPACGMGASVQGSASLQGGRAGQTDYKSGGAVQGQTLLQPAGRLRGGRAAAAQSHRACLRACLGLHTSRQAGAMRCARILSSTSRPLSSVAVPRHCPSCV